MEKKAIIISGIITASSLSAGVMAYSPGQLPEMAETSEGGYAAAGKSAWTTPMLVTLEKDVQSKSELGAPLILES